MANCWCMDTARSAIFAAASLDRSCSKRTASSASSRSSRASSSASRVSHSSSRNCAFSRSTFSYAPVVSRMLSSAFHIFCRSQRAGVDTFSMPRRRIQSSSDDASSMLAGAVVALAVLVVVASRRWVPVPVPVDASPPAPPLPLLLTLGRDDPSDVEMRFIGVQLAGDSGLPANDPSDADSFMMAPTTGLFSRNGSSLSLPSMAPNGLGWSTDSPSCDCELQYSSRNCAVASESTASPPMPNEKDFSFFPLSLSLPPASYDVGESPNRLNRTGDITLPLVFNP